MSPSKTREPQRIAKLLARAGIASRREIERMIEERRIALNGQPIETPATLLTSLHGITVDGKAVNAPAPARLFLYHKPVGQLVTEFDPKGRATIYDKLPADLPRLMPVGRLDYNTEGLLLMTTDGGLKRELELPSSGVERVYRARAMGNVTQDQLEALIEGVEIDGIRYGSIDANMERRTGANVWIEVRITEGKNREVRRVLEHLGLQVNRLIRLAYGPFILGELPVGEIGEVRQHDLIEFRKGMKPASRTPRGWEKAGAERASRPARDGAKPAARPAFRKSRAEEPVRGERPAGKGPARRTDERDSARPARPATGRGDNPRRAGATQADAPRSKPRPPRRDDRADAYGDTPRPARGQSQRNARPDGKRTGRPARAVAEDRAPRDTPTRGAQRGYGSAAADGPSRRDKPTRDTRPPRASSGKGDARGSDRPRTQRDGAPNTAPARPGGKPGRPAGPGRPPRKPGGRGPRA